MLKSLLPTILAMVAGASVVTQAVLNSSLRASLQSAAWSGFVSYAGGVFCMLLVIAVLREPLPGMEAVARVPWYGWIGGMFGTIFIVLGIILVPMIGSATFFVAMLAGQMLVSVIFDHFGLFGLTQRPIDLTRIAALALLAGGVYLIRRGA